MSKEAFISVLSAVAILVAVALATILLVGLYDLMNADHSVIKYELDATTYYSNEWAIQGVRDYYPDSEIMLSKYEYTFEQMMEKIDELNEQIKRQPGRDQGIAVEVTEK